MRETNNMPFYNMDTSIELLGYAKNYIIEAGDGEEELPEKYKILLAVAFDILNEVQEYLYTA